MSAEELQWPNLVGMDGKEAVRIIKSETGFTEVHTVPCGAAVTCDYRTDRVRVFVDKNGKVRSTPNVG